MHYGGAILTNIQKLQKTMIKYLVYTNHLQFSLRCYHNKRPIIGDVTSFKILVGSSRDKHQYTIFVHQLVV